MTSTSTGQRVVNALEAAGRCSIGKGEYPLLALALALAVTAALLSLLAYPAFAQAEPNDEDPLWKNRGT